MLDKNYEEIYSEYKEIRDKIDNVLKTNDFNLIDPSLLLGNQAISLITNLKDLVRLQEIIIVKRKDFKDTLEREISIFVLGKRLELEKEGKKITEGLLDNYVNENIEIYNKKLELNKLEALESVISDEIKVLIEIIQLLKKIADTRTNVDVKLGTNFEIGD